MYHINHTIKKWRKCVYFIYVCWNIWRDNPGLLDSNFIMCNVVDTYVLHATKHYKCLFEIYSYNIIIHSLVLILLYMVYTSIYSYISEWWKTVMSGMITLHALNLQDDFNQSYLCMYWFWLGG
jgi:hypothetical protein